jgi:phenylalanyl-tRNA synthetase beta chain
VFTRELKDKLSEIGLTEVQTYSYVSTQVLENLYSKDDPDAMVKIYNPMSKETTYLRQHLWENLVEVIGKNQKYNLEDIAIFEVGKSYWIGEDKKPGESWQLAIALMNDTDNPLNELLKIVDGLGLNIDIEATSAPEKVSHIFHPTRFLVVKKDGEGIGGASEVHPRSLDKFNIQKRVAVFEITLTTLT